MTIPSNEIIIYETKDGKVKVELMATDGTVWLTQADMAKLFHRERSVIAKHISIILKEGELPQSQVCAKFAQTASDGKTYQIMYYNLDMIFAVGYRVKSNRGTQFRNWASTVLKEYLVTGYSLNQHRLNAGAIAQMQEKLRELSNTLTGASVRKIVSQVSQVMREYGNTWTALFRFDEDEFDAFIDKTKKKLVELEYTEAISAVDTLKQELLQKEEATELFGREVGQGLKAIVRNVVQTFDGKSLYPTNIERAAHLLYFVIKGHPFTDGNKRIGVLLFLLYLSKAGIPLRFDDCTMTALALLIAQSDPSNKDTLVRLVIHMLST
jgi:DNA ligase (NAD+)